jgi:hypothetical protein
MAHTYLYADELKVNSIVFAFGPSGGGQAVAILGRGFVSGAGVTFNGTPATGVTVANSSTIYCTTPAGTPGSATVRVTNPDATFDDLVDGYLYQSATGRFVTTGVGPIRRQPSISIQDTLGQAKVCTFTAETEPLGEQDVQLVLSGHSLFAGTVEDKVAHVDGDSTNTVWDVTVIDYTTRLNSRRPFGVYNDVSVSTIVSGLGAAYAPEFTFHVEGALPHATITIDGSQDFTAVLGTLASLAGGGHFYLEGLDLWFYLNDPGNNNPDTVTDANVLRSPNQDPRLELDYRSIRNRIYIFGAGGIVTQVDDTTSQALYGVKEGAVRDTSLTTSTQLTARGNVELKNFANPIPTFRYSTNDIKTIAGKFITAAVVNPPISGTYLIQEVGIDQINEDKVSPPRYTVMASPVRFTFADLLGTSIIITQEPTPPGLGGDINSVPGGPVTIPDASVPASKLAGCIPSSSLLPTGVTPGAYGDGASTILVTINDQGQATAAASVPIAISEAQVAGLVADLQLLTSRSIPIIYPDDTGDDAMVIPGLAGPTGTAGATGPAGPMGPVLFVEDGQPGMDGMMIPSSGGSGSGTGSAWSVLTNGDGASPELMFDSFGDVIMTETLR